MTETEWLTCDDSRRMLNFLVGNYIKVSDRKLRLFAKACCCFAGENSLAVKNSILEIFGGDIVSERLSVFDWAMWWCNGNFEIPTKTERAVLLRDIFGNPFHLLPSVECEWCYGGGKGIPYEVSEAPHFYQKCSPCKRCDGSGNRAGLTPTVMKWNDATIPRIAQSIYEERRFQDMPILGDALEEAGCDNADILNHCRGMELCSVCDRSGKVGCVHRHGVHGPGFYECENCNGVGWVSINGTELCSVCNRSGKVGCVHRHGVHGPGFYECENCNGVGWVSINSLHVRGCWLVDLILGRE